MAFASNTVHFKYTATTGFDLDSSSYDAYLILFFVLFPIYLYESYGNGFEYNIVDVVVANISLGLILFGVILFVRAIKVGRAGPLDAIQNSKVIT